MHALALRASRSLNTEEEGADAVVVEEEERTVGVPHSDPSR